MICDEGREKEAVVRLSRIGYDNVLGYLEGGIKTWKNAGNKVIEVDLMNANKFVNEHYKKDKNVQLLDVRNPGELSSGYIEGAKNLSLWELEDIISKNPETLDASKPVYVTCQRGARGVSAVSILSAAGFPKLVNIDGGMNALKETDIKISYKE